MADQSVRTLQVVGALTPGRLLVVAAFPEGGYYLVDAGTALATGSVVFANLPTSDPHVVGALYANSTVLSISQG
jgi:hypothetical protein